jgi:hypothetical protein
MPCSRVLFCLVLGSPLAAGVLGISPVWGQPGTAERPPTPWGVSASASSFRDHATWFPRMRAAGVSTVRLFPEWRGCWMEASSRVPKRRGE